MCISLVGRIVELDDEHAAVDIGGSRRRVSLALLRLEGHAVAPDDHVLVHNGFAMSVLDPTEAAELTEHWRALTDRADGTPATKETEPR